MESLRASDRKLEDADGALERQRRGIPCGGANEGPITEDRPPARRCSSWREEAFCQECDGLPLLVPQERTAEAGVKRGKPVIFISSTSELREEREELAAALRPLYEPYLYEEDRARRGSPEERCRELIGESDVFLGILGPSYGSPFAAGVDERSIVEWEFDTARSQKDLEIMMFVRRGLAGAEAEPRQQRFIERVTDFHEGVWCKFFESERDLVSEVRQALERWLVEFWSQMAVARARFGTRLTRILTAIAAGVAIGTLTITVLQLRSPFLDRAALLGVYAIAAVTILLCIVLLLMEIGGRYEGEG